MAHDSNYLDMTILTVSASSPKAHSFKRYSEAPASVIALTYRLSECTDTAITLMCGNSALMVRVASICSIYNTFDVSYEHQLL